MGLLGVGIRQWEIKLPEFVSCEMEMIEKTRVMKSGVCNLPLQVYFFAVSFMERLSLSSLYPKLLHWSDIPGWCYT